jgi:ABC-type uncharacterized transport system substrate-binding protein
LPRLFEAALRVGNNLVASLARPGGNVTGLSIQQTDTAGKRIELFREVGLRRLAILANIGSSNAVLDTGEISQQSCVDAPSFRISATTSVMGGT